MSGRFSVQAMGSMAIVALYALLALGVTIAATRLLGIEAFGTYAAVIAHVNLALAVVVGGLPMLLVREITAADHAGDPGLVRGALIRARQWIGLTSAVILCAGLGIWALGGAGDWPQVWLLGFALLIGLALLEAQGAALRALGLPVLGQVPASLLRPGLHLLILVALGLTGVVIGPDGALVVFAAAALIAVIASSLMLAPRVPRAAPALFRSRAWFRALLAFMFAGGLLRANQHLGGVLLEHLSDRREVALFQPVVQMSLVMLMGRQAITAVLTPRLKRALLAQSEASVAEPPQRLIALASLGAFAMAGAAAAVLLLIGPDGFESLLGPGFGALYPVLAIMALGQLAALGFGHPMVVLNQAGHENAAARVMAASFAANLILGLCLIPHLGATGAALAAVSAQLAATLWQSAICRRRLGLRTDILAILKRDG